MNARNPYGFGYAAGMRGDPLDSCPYVGDLEDPRDWRAGHQAGLRAREVGGPTVVHAGVAVDLAAALRALVERAEGIDGPSYDEIVAAKDALRRAQWAGVA